MFLIVGLGNPGKKYAANRHNVGFVAADELRVLASLPDFKDKFSGLLTQGSFEGESIALLKPMTYMNVSGDSVQPAAAFLKVGPANVVVMHDELDLPFGDVRIKIGGGHAGNNGIRSIIQRLGTPDFVRIRIGIGRPPPEFKGDVADYVLADFTAEQRTKVPDSVSRAMEALRRILRDGITAAMNAINERPKPVKPPKPRTEKSEAAAAPDEKKNEPIA